MKLFVFWQLLFAVLELCRSEEEPHTTVILQDARTEMTVEEAGHPDRSKTGDFFESLRESEGDGNDLDFEYDDDHDDADSGLKTGDKAFEAGEQEMQEVLLQAMRKPAIRKQIGEVVPILRVMSPAQRLTLAALVSSQIASQNALSESNLSEVAAMFAGKKVENPDDRHNITEHLLLPISMDIAKMFKGLGKEMGRNLRENFHRSPESVRPERKFRRVTRKPGLRKVASADRRMDGVDYSGVDHSEEDSTPAAEALKQPGRDECDFFTKNLCLEVPNYPTEAIISSLRKNEDVAKTFLADFEVLPEEEAKIPGSGRRLERRQDGKNEIQDSVPEGGYMCPSSVKYARPKRARTTSGQWKYVVNAGDYTQTLRLEICQKPKSPCSYVTNHLNSQCAQVFNYHRLLTWDESKGLHMDVFKVPSCCSCHIQGYSTFFPPNKDFTFAEKRREPEEAAEFASEPPERPSYGYVGNKREVPKPIPAGSPPPPTIRAQPKRPANAKDFLRNPADHLVPPGPPLPLENEGDFYSEPKYSQRKNPQEPSRRYPPELTRVVGPPAERVEFGDPLGTLVSKTRLKAPPGAERPTGNLPQTRHPAVVAGPPQETIPVFDPGQQVLFLRPSPHTPPPPPFALSEAKKGWPQEGGLFAAPNYNSIQLSGPRVPPNPPAPHFEPEFEDAKGLPSRVSPFFVTPPKASGIESRISTASPPPQKSELATATSTSTGQKKINYNYHPIIDFFVSDTKKRRSSFSPPQYLPATSQEWTPVLGH